MAMHILQLNTEKGWRGGERQTLLTMIGLREAGVKVSLLCLLDAPLYKKAIDAGFAVAGVKTQFAALWYLLLHARTFTVMHAQSSRIFGFAAFAKVINKIPLVYSRRVDFVPRGAITRWKYHQADALIAVSEAIRTILRSAGMGDSQVISDIVSGHVANRERCRLLEAELQLHGKQVVGTIAALVGHKDPVTMIKAAALVKERVPDVVFLHFGDGPLRTVAEEECRKRGLDSAYRLMGYLTDVEDFFPLFNCFAISSSEEGLGSTVLDAFCAGVPVAATAAGGLKELVAGRGLLCAVGDADALAENIIRLLDRRPDDGAMVEDAKEYANRNHGRAVLIGRFCNVYKRITHECSL